jgi:hypothetical protein
MAKKNNTNGNNKNRISLINLEASGEKAFFMANGRVITRLSELPEVIENTDDQTFSYHVNEDKNDFANWIRDVFNSKPLANKILTKRTRTDMVNVLKTELR